MTSTVLKFALGQAIKGKKKEHNKNKEVQQNSTDPFYYFPNGGTKRRDRRERPRPAEVRSDNDWAILRTVRRRAHRLDQSREILGIKFGLSSIIGLIPVVGDFLEVFLSLLLIRKCTKIDGGLPVGIKMRMLIYIVLDFAIGLVPLIGDLVDVAFRANTRISWRLEKYLIEKAGGDLEKASVATAGVIEPSQSTPAPPPRQHSRTGPTDRSDDVPMRPVPAAVTAGGRRDRPQRTRTGPR